MRLTPEDFPRLQPAGAHFLSGTVASCTGIPVIRPSERPEICPPEPAAVAESIYSHLTARDLSVRLQPYSLQSASRRIFKVRGFL
ncbi:hypothetical protein EEI76_21735 (plasmid) [Enterobacter cloacae]|nr:hypothetical protein EEI76_21735 [Enterobacter cloacae]